LKAIKEKEVSLERICEIFEGKVINYMTNTGVSMPAPDSNVMVPEPMLLTNGGAIYTPPPSTIIMPMMSVADAKLRRDTVYQFIKDVLVEGKDYGVIPSTSKPTLLQPGAEQFRIFFGLTLKILDIKIVEDPHGLVSGSQIPFYSVTVQIGVYKDNQLICVGVGQANSQEVKWGYRWVPVPFGEKPPTDVPLKDSSISEFDFAVDKAETSGKYGKPAEYWQQFKDAIKAGTARKINKKDSKGVDRVAIEIGTMLYRTHNDEVMSQANTILKIANKRGMVDGIKDACGISDIFTQDMEDYEGETYTPNWTSNSQPASAPAVVEPPQPTPQGNGASPVTAGDTTSRYPVVPMPRQVAGASSGTPGPGKPVVQTATAPAKTSKAIETKDYGFDKPTTPKPTIDVAPSVDMSLEENQKPISIADLKAMIEYAQENGVGQKALVNYVKETFGTAIMSGDRNDPDRKVLLNRGQMLKTKTFITNGLLKPDQVLKVQARARFMKVDWEAYCKRVEEVFKKQVKHLTMPEMLDMDEWMEANGST
jgi:hypothetical protein